MRFENVQSIGDLKNFFTSNGFEIQKHDENLIKIDKSHFLQVKIVDILDHDTASKEHKDFKKKFRDIPYQLLIDRTFQKFIFQRDYGTPLRFTYDKTKHYARETEGSIFKKLNLLKFENSDFNTTINNLFDIKEIVNKFYEEYKRIRKKLSSAIKNLDGDPNLYAQIIMDRIIFLYFLQTKGILPKTFLSDLYYNKKRTENFYRDYLIPLFFQMLNTEKHSKELIRKFGSVPYLNGGLFSPKDIETKNGNVQISDSVWDHVFKLLNDYEWVIEEDKGDSTTLTPSILGHIYEKSVIAATQKETGSYYTPEEITAYISKNTIYPYITDRVNEKFNTKYKNIWKELLNKTQHTKEEIEQVKFIYFDVLKNLKICDNACGSGAFLIAAQQILVPIYWRCIKALEDKPLFREEWNEIRKYKRIGYYIKRTIITKNLYGVDIQEGAVEIAKLRLWLSMVSEMELKAEDIEPLPNIDYNLLAGNSLIGYIKLPERWGSTLFDDPQKIKKLLEERQKLVNIYRDTRSSTEAKQLEKDIERINKKIREELDEMLFNEFKAKGIKITKEEFNKLKPFHWGFEFYDVFNGQKPEEERGFDIIIGNPPYINIYELSKDINQIKIYQNFYSSAHKKFDIYVIFIERSINLLRENAYFSYIVSNKLLYLPYGEKIRKMMLNDNQIKEIIDLREYNVFVGVGIKNIIFILNKNKKANYNLCVAFPQENPLITGLKLKRKWIKSSLYTNIPSFMFRTSIDDNTIKILKEIEKQSIKLGKIFYVNWGCRPVPLSKFFGNFKNLTLKSVKRAVKGESVNRYFIDYKDTHLKYEPKKLYNPMFPQLFENVGIFVRDIAGGKSINAVLNDQKFYTVHTVSVCVPKYILAKKFEFPQFEIEESKKYDTKFILSLINSNLVYFYFYHLLTDFLHTVPDNIKNFPIKYTKNQQPFITLCDYMLFLNATEERRNSEKELIEFIDKQIIDSLVYELYFKEELKTNLLQLIEPYLKDIETLKSDEEKLRTIKQIVEKIKSDERIMKEIKKIKSHKWVKIIEGVGNV